ncbi:MAG: hypothetical protein RSA27_01305, partial [Oscillospiraceae bacterium]
SSANIHYNYIPPESNKIDAIGSYVDKVEIKKEIVDDKAIFTITVLGDATVDLSKITLRVAEYNSVKTLIRFNTGTNLVTDGKLVITADLPKTEIYKYMLWDHNQVPIIDGISKINGSK